MKVRTLITAGIVLVAGASLAHADGPYGYDAAGPEECTAEFPVFQSFEDGSAGCFREDTPALQPWEPGEYESSLLNDDDYAWSPEERAELEAATEGTPYDQTPQHRPNLPKTGW